METSDREPLSPSIVLADWLGRNKVGNMAECVHDPMLVVASEKEMPVAQRTWGTGGWLQPE
jgi:hypothetical protein